MADQNNAPDAGLAAFAAYFRRNYPGPDTVIMNPDWHAPRIWRAAIQAYEADPNRYRQAADLARADRAAPEGQVQALEHLRNVMGHIDTPIARRHLRINENQPEWLAGAREFLAAITPPTAAPMEICSKCMGTGTAGHPDSGYTCDCNGGMVAAPTDNTALVDVLASLAAAISLLERGGKKAAPSDKMFEQMLIDYRASLERGRTAALASREAPPACQPVEEWDHCTCGPCPLHPAPADREALVRFLQIITRNGSLDDGRTLHEVIADAMLARGLHDLKGES